MRSSPLLRSLGLLLAVGRPRFGVLGDTSFDEPFTSSFTRLSHAPCVRLFHRDGWTGCGTESRSVQKGDLKYFDGSLPESDEPYVAVVEEYDLTAQSVDTLAAQAGGPLQGILVLNSTSSSSSGGNGNNNNNYNYNKRMSEHSFRSPDSKTPRGYGTPAQEVSYGYYSYQWNAKGEDLFAENLYGIPMAYVKDSDVADSIRQEAKDESGSDEAKIVAEFDYYMGPEQIDSIECLAWKNAATDEWSPKCLPLGGASVWATAGSPGNSNANANNNNANNNNNDNYNGYYDDNGNNNNNGGRERELETERSLSKRSVIMLATGMDSTSMFHDISPGANGAVSGTLALLMAAKLIGANIDDNTLDGLPKRIAFGFFQGETYGFLGSRAFLRDLAYPGFKCDGSVVPSVARLKEKSDYACLNPLRPSLKFANLGNVAGMLAVDQVGRLVGDGLLYVHADQDNDNYGSFLANILKYSGTDDLSVASSSAEKNNNYGYPYPPSPLTSLLSLSGGAVGGAVLTGYDYAFSNTAPYHSHLDSASIQQVNYDAIASTATILARAAIAAAYDDGSYDYETASAYALDLIPELSSDDEHFVELANCLLNDGECSLLKSYSSVEVSNENIRTGLNVGMGSSLGNPPNYYVGVYGGDYGQPFVQVGDKRYGAYEGDDYGNKNSDAIGMRPRVLESSIHGLLNDYLGRGGGMSESGAVSCKKVSDCGDVDYCASNGDSATCTGGGVCVCKRAHYHVALDEALVPAKNMPPYYFEVSENDQGISAMYTEPFWSPNVGVRVYRDVGSLPGFLTLAAGGVVAGISLFAALVLKVGLKKEKLY